MERVRLYAALLRGSLDEIQRAITLAPKGRGHQFVVLVQFVLDSLRQRLETIDAEAMEAGENERMLRIIGQKYERQWPALGLLHRLVAQYLPCVGRSDLSVGFLHIIDELMDAVIFDEGDALVRLNDIRMYSTSDIANDIIRASLNWDEPLAFSEAHPIAFNLPELNPENALYAPILAHEVTHTVIQQRYRPDIWALITSTKVGDILNRWLARVETDDQLNVSQQWTLALFSVSQEYVCDVVAACVTGPAFLYATVPFGPPPAEPIISDTHPPTHQRWRLTLSILRELGWAEFLSTHSPNVLTAVGEEAAKVAQPKNLREAFLLEASEAILPDLVALGRAHIPNPMIIPDQPTLDAAADLLSNGIPAVEHAGATFSTWTIILAAWLVAIRQHGDGLGALAEGVSDEQFNGLIVKSIELAVVADWWHRS
jgi:hypothetical protein